MKLIKWKILIITCLVCVLPVIFGVALWNELPESMAIHFNFYNEPDNFSSRGFALFGLPVIMVILQIICCVASDINSRKYEINIKFERITKWIIPVMTIALQIITVGYNLGWSIDIRKSAAILVGAIFILTGNCLPELNYVKNCKADTEKAKKINKTMGILMVVMGILMLITAFLPPVFTM